MEAPAPSLLHLPDGSTLAYRATAGASPAVVFLGGYSSDMTGTKAVALEQWCRERGQAYLRFDYSGHGASSGRFEEGTLGRWASDAMEVVDRLTSGPLVLVGSSMGGWVMLLVALAHPARVQGLVGIASAPDFTEELVSQRLAEGDLRRLYSDGRLLLPNPYGPEPTPLTLRFIEEARRHLLLEGPIPLACPVRLVHGLEDADVPWQTSLRLAQALESQDVTLTLVKGSDHRLSDPASLRRLFDTLEGLCREKAAP